MLTILPNDARSYVGMSYANPHAPTSENGVTYTYDNNGNLTYDGTHTYTWDYQNRLTAVGTGSGTTAYAYDHMGNRVKKVEGGIATLYPNRFYNVTTESTPTATKHIFAGENRGAMVIRPHRSGPP